MRVIVSLSSGEGKIPFDMAEEFSIRKISPNGIDATSTLLSRVIVRAVTPVGAQNCAVNSSDASASKVPVMPS